MKKISMTLCSLMVVLALGACSGGNDAAKTETTKPDVSTQANTSAASASTGSATLSPEEQVEAREKI